MEEHVPEDDEDRQGGRRRRQRLVQRRDRERELRRTWLILGGSALAALLVLFLIIHTVIGLLHKSKPGPADAGTQTASAQEESAEGQAQDPDSLLNTVKAILALRHRFPELQADGSLEVVHARKDDPLLVYRRGKLTLALNPSNKVVKTELTGKPLFQIGTYEKGVLGACSFVVID